MKAHIVGGGFGGLAAAALLIRNADVPGQDITIYEANDKLGGGFFLDGSATSSSPACPAPCSTRNSAALFDLLATIPTELAPNISVKEQFFTFNKGHPFVDQVHIVDSALRTVHGPRYGLSWRGGLAFPRVAVRDARGLAGRAAHRGVLPLEVFRDRILAALVDDHGVDCRSTA